MISIRQYAGEQGHLLRILSSSDFLWDALTEMPDYYCSTLEDFISHSNDIRGGRLVEVPKVRYFPTGDEGKCLLSDATGVLEAEVRENSLGAAIQKMLKAPPSRREILAEMNPGDELYDVHIVRSKGMVYLSTFKTKGPAVGEQDPYKKFGLPKLAPVRVHS